MSGHDPGPEVGVSERGPAARVHDLKCWPGSWEAINDGRKTLELRHDDRAYRVGDVLILREWDPNMALHTIGPGGPYTGRVCRRQVTHVLSGGQFGLAAGYVALSLADDDTVEGLTPEGERLRTERAPLEVGVQPLNVVQEVLRAWVDAEVNFGATTREDHDLLARLAVQAIHQQTR